MRRVRRRPPRPPGSSAASARAPRQHARPSNETQRAPAPAGAPAQLLPPHASGGPPGNSGSRLSLSSQRGRIIAERRKGRGREESDRGLGREAAASYFSEACRRERCGRRNVRVRCYLHDRRRQSAPLLPTSAAHRSSSAHIVLERVSVVRRPVSIRGPASVPRRPPASGSSSLQRCLCATHQLVSLRFA